MQFIEIIYPDDWHVHLRDEIFLKSTVPYAACNFGRVLVMPNLPCPLITVEDLIKYRDRILALIPAGSVFTPYMTLYLNNLTTPEILTKAKQLTERFHPSDFGLKKLTRRDFLKFLATGTLLAASGGLAHLNSIWQENKNKPKIETDDIRTFQQHV